MVVDDGRITIYFSCYICKYFIHKLLRKTRHLFSIPSQLLGFRAEVDAQDIWLKQLTENCANFSEHILPKNNGQRILCLDPNDRICEGTEAKLGELPWQANIASKNDRGHFCGGILLCDRFILTAAHCVVNKWAEDILVILGDHNIDNDFDRYETEHDVKKIILHPKYFKGWTDDYVYQCHNDIALLQLTEPVRISNGVRSACLPKYEPKNGAKDMLISGWGTTEDFSYSDVLLKAEVDLIPRKKCEEMYSIPELGQRGNITERMICAASPGKDTCQGDSGGIL